MSLKYYIVDTETTGLKPSWHEMHQISIIRCDDRNQLSKYIRCEHPERANDQALEITKRTRKDIIQGESLLSVIESVDSFLALDGVAKEHRCMIAHNAPFDKNFCHFAWNSCKKIFPADLWLDTKTFAKSWANKLGIEKPKLTLGAALDFTGITPVQGTAHNAITDSRNTYMLWKKGMDEGIDHLPHIKLYLHQNDSE